MRPLLILTYEHFPVKHQNILSIVFQQLYLKHFGFDHLFFYNYLIIFLN